MNNAEFKKVLKQSFQKYLNTSSRSNEKLKILHGEIIRDLKSKLNKYDGNFELDEEVEFLWNVKGLGDDNKGKEIKLQGRYLEKTADMTISYKNENIATIELKFIMQNYLQNKENYFYSMMGETANLRSTNKYKCFQIIILPMVLPYFSGRIIKKLEFLEDKNIKGLYENLERDFKPESYYVPNKILVYMFSYKGFIKNNKLVRNLNEFKDLLGVPEDKEITFEDYKNWMERDDNSEIVVSDTNENFDRNDDKKFVYNNYTAFIFYVVKELTFILNKNI